MHYLIILALLLVVAYVLGLLLGWFLRSIYPSDRPLLASAPVETAPEPARETFRAAAAVPQSAVPAAAEPAMASAPAVSAAPAAAPAPPRAPRKAEEAADTEAAASPGKMARPKGIAAARGGKPDKLQRISGIGPKNEKILHGLGFFHFDQIAAWSKEQVAWVDDHLKFGGRIAREGWIKQARLLADGKEAEFAKLYGSGGMKNSNGEKVAGSRTRRS